MRPKQQLTDSYASALASYDVLLMPTIACKPKKLPEHLGTPEDYEGASAELVEEHGYAAYGMVVNTAPINLTGHPALSLPVGGSIVTMVEEQVSTTKQVALPVSVMLVGGYFQEATLYRVGYALQQARPWPSFLFHQSRPLQAS